MITYIFTPICDKYIARALYTLYKYSEPGSFDVIVIDQCKDQFRPEVMAYVKPLIHLYIHPKRNLGYAKAMNEGMIHALHWKSDLICCANDDIEIIHPHWIRGVEKTFAMHKNIVSVTPMTPRVAGWGYGVPGYPEVLPYKEEYTDADYEYLLKGDFRDKTEILPKTMPREIGGTIVDGAVFIFTYFKREALEEIGLFDEHFFPGSGEDMDWNTRAYIKDYRVVSTSLSWIWHHWTKSKDLFASGELEDHYYKPLDHPYWNNIEDLWRPQDNDGHHYETWGRYDVNGIKRKLVRIPEVFVDKI